MFRQIRSKLLAAFAVPWAILVGVAGLAISSNLSQTKSAQGRTEAAALVALGLAGALLGLLLVIRVQPGGLEAVGRIGQPGGAPRHSVLARHRPGHP